MKIIGLIITMVNMLLGYIMARGIIEIVKEIKEKYRKEGKNETETKTL